MVAGRGHALIQHDADHVRSSMIVSFSALAQDGQDSIAKKDVLSATGARVPLDGSCAGGAACTGNAIRQQSIE